MEIPASVAIARWKIAGLLRVSGTDAEIFLQGQFTNDVKTLGANRGVYGLWLNQKGKVLADSFVLRGPQPDAGDFFVVSYFSCGGEIRKRLEDYIIADDVVIEDLTETWTGIALVGAGASAWLLGQNKAELFFPGRRARAENWEWIFPQSEVASVADLLAGVREVPVEQLERMRVAERIPAVPFDLGPGDLPAEGGLDVEAISYTKGCYLGQEVMARLKSMGQVRRRLLVVRGKGPRPLVPGKLKQGEKVVGELRTAVTDGDGFLGLAMMSLVNLRKDFPVTLEADGAVVLDLDFGSANS